MNKYLMMILVISCLTACTTKDEQYFRNHPDNLREALKKCPNISPEAVSCNQLEQLAGRLNSLAYQLQRSPQGVGQKILFLQERIAKQEIEMQNNKEQSEFKTSLEQDKRELADYLAVVKWLESPEG